MQRPTILSSLVALVGLLSFVSTTLAFAPTLCMARTSQNARISPCIEDPTTTKATAIAATTTTTTTTSLFSNNPTCQVTLKIAIDPQGGVADRYDPPGRFTSGESLDMVHRLRRVSDAVLVGRTTVQRDDCSLTIRRGDPLPPKKQPLRVILDPRQTLASTLAEYAVATDPYDTVLYYALDPPLETTTGSDPARHSHAMPPRERTIDRDHPTVEWVGLHPTPPATNPPTTSQTETASSLSSSLSSSHASSTPTTSLSARSILHDLSQHYNVRHLMVEGGPTTAKAFLAEQLVDRVILVQAPHKFAHPLLSGLSPNAAIWAEAGLEHLGHALLGEDRVDYWSRPGCAWPTTLLSEWP